MATFHADTNETQSDDDVCNWIARLAPRGLRPFELLRNRKSRDGEKTKGRSEFKCSYKFYTT